MEGRDGGIIKDLEGETEKVKEWKEAEEKRGGQAPQKEEEEGNQSLYAWVPKCLDSSHQVH